MFPRHGSTETRVLSVTGSGDVVLHLISPLGLAAAAGQAVVVDLDPGAPGYPGSQTVARLCSEGPRLEDLVPSRKGIAVLPNGGIDPSAALPLVEALCGTWRTVVLRVPDRIGTVPLVPVRPLIPGFPPPDPDAPAVHQAFWPGGSPRLPGVVLPPIGRAAIRRMLAGGRPSSRRWLAGWHRVWELPWA